MPNIKSAAKRMRQGAKHREHNRTQRATMRTFVKKARAAIVAGGESTAEVIQAVSNLAKMAQKGQIHKNKASRLQSRLARAQNAAKAAATSSAS